MKSKTKISGGDSSAVPLEVRPFLEVIPKAAGLVCGCGIMEHADDFLVLRLQRVGHTPRGPDTRSLTVCWRQDLTTHLVCLQERKVSWLVDSLNGLSD